MKAILTPAAAALAFVGRHGAVGFALSILVGLALPQFAAAMRPVLPLTIICFVTLSFARADAENLRGALLRPARLALAFAWATLLPPLVVLALVAAFRDALGPELVLGLALNAAAPALMGAPAYAALFGFRNGLVLTTLFIGLVITPVFAPPMTSLIAGAAVPLDPWTLAGRLLLQIGGSVAAALLLRRWPGVGALERRRHELNGVNVVLYFLFAIAAMDGVLEAVSASPGRVLGYAAAAFGVSAFNFVVSLAALRRLGPNDTFTLALCCGLRNTGLLVAALGLATPPGTYLFFALTQFPVYFAPLLVARLARRYAAAEV